MYTYTELSIHKIIVFGGQCRELLSLTEWRWLKHRLDESREQCSQEFHTRAVLSKEMQLPTTVVTSLSWKLGDSVN